MAAKPPADHAISRFGDTHFDALLVVAFGGPEGFADVLPFLANVTRGRDVPRERLEEVARHYDRFGGVSPINAQNRALIAALGPALAASGIELPIYVGNRNWHPLLADTIRDMSSDGVERALALFATPYSSYSSCRQYRENIYDAQVACGADAPEVLKIRAFYNHPGFVEANAARLESALAGVGPARHRQAPVVFTAHSIPLAMAEACRYATQLEETARLVAEAVGHEHFELAYQSRSGSAHVPWLEPGVDERIRAHAAAGVSDVVLSPIGFLSDHIEVLFDLDVEARALAEELGLVCHRAETVGTHPAFIEGLADLVEERLRPDGERAALGAHGLSSDECRPGCCLPGTGRPSPWDAVDAAVPARTAN